VGLVQFNVVLGILLAYPTMKNHHPATDSEAMPLPIAETKYRAPMAKSTFLRLRGRLVGLVQFNVVLGILLAYLSNWLIAQTLSERSAWPARSEPCPAGPWRAASAGSREA
jgi:hypothetical protein